MNENGIFNFNLQKRIADEAKAKGQLVRDENYEEFLKFVRGEIPLLEFPPIKFTIWCGKIFANNAKKQVKCPVCFMKKCPNVPFSNYGCSDHQVELEIFSRQGKPASQASDLGMANISMASQEVPKVSTNKPGMDTAMKPDEESDSESDSDDESDDGEPKRKMLKLFDF